MFSCVAGGCGEIESVGTNTTVKEAEYPANFLVSRLQTERPINQQWCKVRTTASHHSKASFALFFVAPLKKSKIPLRTCHTCQKTTLFSKTIGQTSPVINSVLILQVFDVYQRHMGHFLTQRFHTSLTQIRWFAVE